MNELTGIWQANLNEILKEIGEDRVKAVLSGFLCPLNRDVEQFIQEKAILFSRHGYATTYLIFMSYKGEAVLVGYYALANKAVTIKGSNVNASWKRRLARYAVYEKELKQYTIALPLIGQLGKNYANGYDKLITGDELLGLACEKVRSIQMMMSGKMAYLECEDIEKLTAFYERNGFCRFANRNLDRDEIGNCKTQYLVQMIKYFG